MERETRDGLLVLTTLLAALAVVFGVVAIGLSVRDDDGGGGAAAEAIVETVTLSDFKIEPKNATVKAGQIILDVINRGPSEHNLAIPGIGATQNLKVGQEAEWDIGILESGTYTWYCSIPGHKEAGMEGTLTVTGTAGAKTSGLSTSGGGDAAAAAGGAADWELVDAQHKKAVDDFLAGPPAKTAGLGNQPLQPKIENGTKVFELTTSVVQWEVAPGKVYEAWTYNGTVPGPEIRVDQGETVKVRVVKNNLPQSTSIHWHGVEIDDQKQDGVTYVNQDPIKPGESYEYTLTPINCGSHMYHSHHAADAQVPLGLIGAFIVNCKTTPVPAFAAHDTEYTQIVTDGPLGFGINGKGFPATEPIVAKPGEKTLIRFMNEGLIIHPMHLHGHRMLVVAKDGNYLPAPYETDTLNIAPGERYDVVVTSQHVGYWAFHCHILTHAESAEGLHGMTTVWVVA